MAVAVTCACGKALRVKDELAGRRVRCPGCGNTLTVPAPQNTGAEEIVELLPADAGSPMPPPRPLAPVQHISPQRPVAVRPPVLPVQHASPRPVPAPPPLHQAPPALPSHAVPPPSQQFQRADTVRHAPAPDYDDTPEDEPRRRRKKVKKHTKKRSRSSGGIAIHPSIIGGALMMIGAVVWFVVGLAVGYIFFYPPILFVLGIVAVVRGFMGSE